MTDDIDAYDQIQTRSRRRTGFHPCRKCGMMITGDECPFCTGRDYTPKPAKKDRWVGRRK